MALLLLQTDVSRLVGKIVIFYRNKKLFQISIRTLAFNISSADILNVKN